jgi:hypothetical protein
MLNVFEIRPQFYMNRSSRSNSARLNALENINATRGLILLRLVPQRDTAALRDRVKIHPHQLILITSACLAPVAHHYE